MSISSRRIRKLLIQAVNEYIGMKLKGKKNNPIFLNSFPKSGTHFLKNILLSMSLDFRLAIGNEIKPYHFYKTKVNYKWIEEQLDRGNQNVLGDFQQIGKYPQTKFEWWLIFKSSDHNRLIIGHVNYNEQIVQVVRSVNCQKIFLYRDPRDVVVSRAHFNLRKEGLISNTAASQYFNKLPDFDSCVREVILGNKAFPKDHILHYDIGETYKRWMGWLNEPGVFPVKYEELNSLSKEERLSCLRRIARHLNVEPTEEIISNMIKAYDIRPENFRRGICGSWKDELNEENKKLITELAGDVIRDLGYE